MSYCVHCGVQLAPSEARCPLCQTPVVDPAAPYDPALPREFPVRSREQRLEINPWTTLALAAVLLTVDVYKRQLYSFTFEGAAGMEKMQAIMARLRQQAPKELGGFPVERVEDYTAGDTGLPLSLIHI